MTDLDPIHSAADVAVSDDLLKRMKATLDQGMWPSWFKLTREEFSIAYAALRQHNAEASAPESGADKVVWFIERKGFAGDPRPHWYWEDARGNHAWTPEASAALPFNTEAEAKAFPAYRMISRDPDITITEHVFLAALRSSPEAPHAALQAEPVVKPLEWEQSDSKFEIWEAVSALGIYRVDGPFQTPTAAGMKIVLPAWRGPFTRVSQECTSVDGAKDAAQADFEARIRSALIDDSCPTGATGGAE